jgi:hypothetical protein
MILSVMAWGEAWEQDWLVLLGSTEAPMQELACAKDLLRTTTPTKVTLRHSAPVLSRCARAVAEPAVD